MSGAAESTLIAKQLQPPAEIFRAYDIRGLYGAQLTEDGIALIGQAIGSEALANDIDTLLIGRDGRLSSPSLIEHLIRGVRASGCHVVDLGITPTPLVYFATHTTPWRSGLMLTASHNPAAYNGVKIVFNQSCLAANQIQDIRLRIENGRLSEGQGDYQVLAIIPDYITQVLARIDLGRTVKIVIDCANGVTGVLAQSLFEALGCEVVPLFCELDGHFPNHEPDPTQPANLSVLCSTVKSSKAEIGLAFDGDGDRLAVVDENGRVIDTDLLLAALIKSIVPSHPGSKVVFDVKCSSRLAPLIIECGGIPVMHRSGHSFMKQKMLETGAPLGGEFSAHIFIKDRWFGFDDGLYTAARVLEVLSKKGLPASRLFNDLGDRYTTSELKIEVDEAIKFSLIEKIRQSVDFPDANICTIDGLRVTFDDGWGLVRASNTSAALLLRFEADSMSSLQNIQAKFKQLLLQIDRTLPINF